MPLALLIDLVHRNGGVLGPAHPCGEKYMSFTHARRYYLSPEIAKRFDFVEAFNSCESTESNAGAEKLARKYGKVTTVEAIPISLIAWEEGIQFFRSR